MGISNMRETKEVDMNKKEEMVKGQERIRKEHLKNPPLGGSAEDKGPGRGSKGRK